MIVNDTSGHELSCFSMCKVSHDSSISKNSSQTPD